MALQKPTKRVDGVAAVCDDVVDSLGPWPLMRAYMLDTQYASGEKRQTATLTLFLNDQGRLGVTLKDREEDRGLFGAGTSLMGALDSIEAQLEAASPGWREDRTKTGSNRRVR